MKKKLAILLFIMTLTLFGCGFKNDNQDLKGLEKQVKVSEKSNKNQNEVDIKTSVDEMDLRKLFKIDDKQFGSIWTYIGPIEYGHILKYKATKYDKANNCVNIIMDGYNNGGVGLISEGENGEVGAFTLTYTVKSDSVVEVISNKTKEETTLGSIIPNKIILKAPLKVGNTWEEKFQYKGKEYTAISKITADEYEQKYSKDKKKYKGYVVETSVKGMDNFENKEFNETRIIDLNKGVIEHSYKIIVGEGKDSFEYPFAYRLFCINNEVPYDIKLYESLKDNMGNKNIESIKKIYPQEKSIETKGMTLVKKVSADIDEDKVNETIELFGEVTMSKEGQIINSNNRNKWCLVVNKGKKQFVLFNDYIQLGELDFWAYDLMDYKQFRITTVKSTTASLVFTDYIFNKQSEHFWAVENRTLKGSVNMH
ncbi:hypothetical protein [Clostridium sp. FP1]|uniref:hypothetical protein n=1 Tax=Clostridium sp. FP1 TaxID=2724076 RepID=UPI0013E99280|nr:hypothetical protein [Clostridium sp. FP1]MBZ9634053.1 hypothetical protein [Clostridium sp. FP1]